MQCDRCGSEQSGTLRVKAGWDRQGRQIYRCRTCGRRLAACSASAFSGYRFPDHVIALAVRWYLPYRLSYMDVVEWLAERGIQMDASTIYDWVRAFTPHFVAVARTHRAAVGKRWRVDETYLKIGKRWHYLYRAIDEHGQIVDAYLSDRRNATAGYPLGEAFLERAINTSDVTPTQVTTGCPLGEAKSYPKALHTLLPEAEHRSSKYLNNRLERDHQQGCPLGQGRVRLMRRFKTADGANNFCRGHTLIRNLSRGFSALTAHIAPRVRLATAWATLALSL